MRESSKHKDRDRQRQIRTGTYPDRGRGTQTDAVIERHRHRQRFTETVAQKGRGINRGIHRYADAQTGTQRLRQGHRDKGTQADTEIDIGSETDPERQAGR